MMGYFAVVVLMASYFEKTSAIILPEFRPAPNFQTMFFNSNFLMSQDDNEPQICDVWLNYEKLTKRGGNKLFEHVSPTLTDMASFGAFRTAYYRTRNEVRHAEHGASVWRLRQKIFEEFLDGIKETKVFKAFRKLFKDHHHPWFTSDFKYLKDHLTSLWVPSSEHAGFDYIFMGNIVKDYQNHDVFDGMHNWFSFYLSEEDNLVHYDNRMTQTVQKYPNGNNPNMKRYNLISDIDFVYNDYRGNKDYVSNQRPYFDLQHRGRTMLMRTSPAFEFCLYTMVALLNNQGGHQTHSHGVYDDVISRHNQHNVFDVTKSAQVEIIGCPIDVRVKLIVVADRDHPLVYITEAYPREDKSPDALFKCNLLNKDGYKEGKRVCGKNDYDLRIEHLARNFTKVL